MDSELLTASNIKIPPKDWALTPSSVQQALLRVLERLAALEEEVSRLRAENERLREQTRRSSRNGSQPPWSDAPSALPRQQRPSSGRKRGAQPGHEGHQRKLYPVEACRSINNHRPAACSACGTALSGDDPNPVRHQVVELPEVKPLVDEHRLHQLHCPDCGKVTRAPGPSDVPASGYGPRPGFAAAVVEIRASVQQWLAAGAAYTVARGDKSARVRTARTCRELLKVEQALWL